MSGNMLDRERHLRWFKEARFGMFITWGLYSQLGRWEWTMHNECIPIREYEKLAGTWRPKARCMRQWARLARDAGMKYMVMTTKHHEGFCLWDSAQTDYNAACRGPGRDLVREYVEACREFDLKVGLYYSLMDWHHPDGMRAASDPSAARRFRDFSYGCVRELCSNYGPVDILWYDNAWPKLADGGWKPERLNAMVRRLQPRILINNRSGTPEDFGTPEGHVTAENPGRAWEACMTMNGAWSYVPCNDWVSVRQILEMLRTAAAGGGNVLLDIGPRADGSVPREASERLKAAGRWIARHGEALYGSVDRTDGMSLMNTGNWTLKGKTAYFWASRWPDTGEIVMGRWEGKVKRATLLTTGKPVDVKQVGTRLFLRGLPVANPDRVAQVPVIKIECATQPRMPVDWSYEDPGE